ncbi:MAG: MotA/TolQ/ExbB proton channel family protein [Microscillaceae bacterium]|nr:MotA/TolQ/ExbB proton channel family protein [Microscillaceae bacterium]
MRKLLTFWMLALCLSFGATSVALAQDEDTTKKETPAETPAPPAEEEDKAVDDAAAEVKVEDQTFYQAIKQKFIEGGWEFMSTVLICLVLGLAVALERIITLNLATINTKKFTQKIEAALNSGGIDAAKEEAQKTRGPIASIFMQGLIRYPEGIDVVEKSVIAYGSVEMAKLEKGLVWISLFIALAPMLGFMGTVIGMIQAFDAIQAAGDISPSLVAGGIKVALITTVSGLIVAIILQLFYNYLVSKVDSIVSQMEEASISLVDLLVAHKNKA